MTNVSYKEALDSLGAKHEVLRERCDGGLRLARLRHSMTEPTYVGETSDYMIAIRLGGSDDVTRFDGNRLDASGSRQAAICISGAENGHGWLFPDVVEVLHVYLERARLQKMVETDLDIDGRGLMIDPKWNAHDPFLHQLALSADGALASAGTFDMLYVDQLEVALAAHVLRHHSNVGDLPAALGPGYRGRDARIARVIDYVEASIEQPLRIAELADVASMSASNLMRSFKAQTGHSVADYVRERRLQHACRLLDHPSATLSQIAFDTGFSDHSHLTRSFKARFGVTPSQWRH